MCGHIFHLSIDTSVAYRSICIYFWISQSGWCLILSRAAMEDCSCGKQEPRWHRKILFDLDWYFLGCLRLFLACLLQQSLRRPNEHPEGQGFQVSIVIVLQCRLCGFRLFVWMSQPQQDDPSKNLYADLVQYWLLLGSGYLAGVGRTFPYAI